MDGLKELHEEIIKKQDELIGILKESIQSRDKYIAILEKQLLIIEKSSNNEQQK